MTKNENDKNEKMTKNDRKWQKMTKNDKNDKMTKSKKIFSNKKKLSKKEFHIKIYQKLSKTQ